MFSTRKQEIIFILILSAPSVLSSTIDQSVFENALDTELCDQQLQEIISSPQLTFTFMYPGIRLPKATFLTMPIDYGNYHVCLKINEKLTNSTLQGKYCSISIQLPPKLFDTVINSANNSLNILETNETKYTMDTSNNVSKSNNENIEVLPITVAICLPKSCTTTQVLEYLSDKTFPDLEEKPLFITENYCRLPNDKLWLPIDYLTIALFAAIGILNVFSTSYDLYMSFVIKKDQKSVNKLLTSFSIYTNTRRLVTYNSSRNTKPMECLDGIRVIATVWVILGHVYGTTVERSLLNIYDIPEWIKSSRSILLTFANVSTVDTFFLLSGLLVVYNTAGNLTNIQLLKNIHLFYLNRVLRLFPMMAVAILLSASIINRVVDGPNTTNVSIMTESCRTYWWYPLLYIQNYVYPRKVYMGETLMCLPHAWFLAIDMQLHLLSPIILFWVVTSKKAAWISLIGVLLVTLIASTTYIFHKNFNSLNLMNVDLLIVNLLNIRDFHIHYYINTLTRASPFLIGMICGYILYTMDARRLFNQTGRLLLWLAAIVLSSSLVYIHQCAIVSDEFDQIFLNLYNSFIRPAWAVAVALLILACHYGFGGPVNWFLSLKLWKTPSRLSYAMYMFHPSLIRAVFSMDTGSVYFSTNTQIMSFFGNFVLIFIVSFVTTVTIDASFMTLIKMAMGGGVNRSKQDQNETKTPQECLKTKL